jgi:indolepyruvate ferredoxin oxidoreductase
MERDLLRWYQDILRDLPARLNDLPEDTVQGILTAPMDIRGYGPVKEAAAQTTRSRVAQMLETQA